LLVGFSEIFNFTTCSTWVICGFRNVFNVKEIWFCMNNRGLVGTIVVVGVLLVVGFFWFVGEKGSGEVSENCVVASCCHASECVWESEAPDCGGIFCSMNCIGGSMDCGAGHCEIVDEKCGVVWDNEE